MSKRFILCISRQFGSNGRIVGEALAEEMGITCYDKKLLEKIASEHNLSEEYVMQADEKPVRMFSRGFPMGFRNPYKLDYIESLYYTFNDNFFSIQAQTIKNIASEGSCIIIGRVADFILRDDPDMLSIFVHADLKYRIKTVMEREGVDKGKAEQMIKKKDKNRQNYYNFYSDKKWGECVTYDFSVSTSKFGVDGAVRSILKLIDY
ncbi:MAG: cytidylate kinase-like family protein [Clostridiales bacterium]|jgi:cytidylate kinase|nr:cytidylate kinase-like family protein [Clostridiales bacterium]